MRHAFKIGFLLAVSLSFSRLCQAAEPVNESARAARVISQLDDIDSTIRKQATLQLNSLGAEALPLVEKAVASPQSLSPERQRRMKKALAILRPRAREQKLREARRQWLKTIFAEAYDHGGHTSSKWDAQAHAAIDAYLTSSLNPAGNSPPLVLAGFNACKAATDLGCDDPLIFVLEHMQAASGTILDDSAQKLPRWNTVRDALLKQHQSDVLGLWIEIDLARAKPETVTVVSQFWTRPFEQIFEAHQTPPEHFDFLARRAYRAIDADPGGISAQMFLKEYKRMSGKTVGTLLCDSDALFKQMSHNLWDKGEGFPESWQSQTKLLNAAEKLNLEAETLDPEDPRPTAQVLRIKTLQYNASPAEVEAAFQHAAEVNPDSIEVYQRKFFYLSPEWRGDETKLLQFGRQCLETENCAPGVPMMLVKVHELLATHSGDADAYFTSPEVRKDINDVFGPHLLNFPDDVHTRCIYAKYAMRCEDWPTAKAQFDLIGDAFDRGEFPSKELYEHDRDKAARLAAREKP